MHKKFILISALLSGFLLSNVFCNCNIIVDGEKIEYKKTKNKDKYYYYFNEFIFFECIKGPVDKDILSLLYQLFAKTNIIFLDDKNCKDIMDKVRNAKLVSKMEFLSNVNGEPEMQSPCFYIYHILSCKVAYCLADIEKNKKIEESIKALIHIRNFLTLMLNHKNLKTYQSLYLEICTDIDDKLNTTLKKFTNIIGNTHLIPLNIPNTTQQKSIPQYRFHGNMPLNIQTIDDIK